MVKDIINTLTKRNKELLVKIEEIEKLRKVEISQEAQLKIIDKVEIWKKENCTVGSTDNIGLHINFELLMVQFLHKKENPLDKLLEMLLSSITRNAENYYKKNREYWEVMKEKDVTKEVVSELSLELKDKKIKINRLEEELKEKELFIEEQKGQIAEAKSEAECHLDFINFVSSEPFKDLNEMARENLEKQMEKKTEDLKIVSADLEDTLYENETQKAEIEKLKQELAEKSKDLEDIKQENGEQKEEISKLKGKLYYSVDKPLPKKELNKLQKLGAKIKTNVQKLREKNENKKLFSWIETKIK